MTGGEDRDALNRVTNVVDVDGTTKHTYTRAGKLLTEYRPSSQTAGLQPGRRPLEMNGVQDSG
jgi:YD repeat-containing protein